MKEFERICRFCGNKYLSKVNRGNMCDKCKNPKLCKCGCGKLVKTPGKFYYGNCSKRGKTYKDIYGTVDIKCGFQKGEENIAKREDIKKKISKGVRESYTSELREKRRVKSYETGFYKNQFGKKYSNIKGENFRSNLEVEFSNFLIKNNIEYEYEKSIKLLNGKRKVVDFVIYGYIFIEITGYAYENWKKDFNKKIKWLKESIGSEEFILILTYKNALDEIFFRNIYVGENVFFGDVKDIEQILKTLEFIKQIKNINGKIEKWKKK